LVKEIDLEVVPLKSSLDPQGKYFLLLFIDKMSESSEDINKAGSKKKAGRYSDSLLEKVKEELKVTKEHLQSIIEEREGTNEELRSALEELQSSNEELQSTNEEMETAREELQSTNEELITTNDELENRNNELNEINNDLNNLLVSINTAIILLGRDLKIRRYTRKAEAVWNLIPGDIGRSISNFKPNFELKNLESSVLEVMGSLESKEIEVRDNNDVNYSMIIRPYKTLDGKIDGTVISLYDVDARTKAMELMTQEKDFYKSVLNTVRQPLLVLDEKLNVHMANDSYHIAFHTSEEEILGKNIYYINNHCWDSPALKKLLEEILPAKGTFNNFEILINSDIYGKKKMLINSSRIKLINEREKMILLAIDEVRG
jgi:two-component system, chemotaxis family, CheB/CheR fusion protein